MSEVIGLDEQRQARVTAEPIESLPRRIEDGPVLTPHGEYIPVEWIGANTSGMKPMGDAVLILPDQPRPTTAGGIELPDQLIERMAYAAETGIIVEVGDGAWTWNADRTRKYEGERPKPGTRIWFERYAGALSHGIDRLIYRLVTDKQIGAIAIPLPEGFELSEDGKHVGRKGQAAQAIAQSAAAERLHKQAVGQMGEIEPDPPSEWPKYLKRNGNVMMAFDETDMNNKARGAFWYATREMAEEQGT